MTLVLLFHGVTKQPRCPHSLRNYNNKHIAVDAFTSLLDNLLSNGYHFYTSQELESAWRANLALPAKSAVITFDDGFLNNYTVALPELIKRRLPATFYISTGNISTNSPFWVDQVEFIFNTAPEALFLPAINNLPFQLEYSPDFSSTESDAFFSRIQVLDKLKSFLKLVHPKRRHDLITEFAASVSVVFPTISTSMHPDYHVMNWQQVREINNHPDYSVGGHSALHNIFSTLSESEQKHEICQSIDDISHNLGSFSGLYAYPEGQYDHFNDTTIRLLKEHDVSSCPSAVHGVADPVSQHLFNYKRLMVGINSLSDQTIRKHCESQ